MHIHHCFERVGSNSCGCIFTTASCESYGGIMVAMDHTATRDAFAKHDALEERRKELGVRVPCFLGQNAVGCRELCEYWAAQHDALEERRKDLGALQHDALEERRNDFPTMLPMSAAKKEEKNWARMQSAVEYCALGIHREQIIQALNFFHSKSKKDYEIRI
ncbi:hypothetical protein SUGI_0493300 [Cryptomeria japonica]|nr:hypothetical protein SUGI_0493300 [Cryptomeria japonica]